MKLLPCYLGLSPCSSCNEEHASCPARLSALGWLLPAVVYGERVPKGNGFEEPVQLVRISNS